MKYTYPAMLSILAAVPAVMLGSERLTVPNVTVGQNLEVATSIKLADAATGDGLNITLTSSDPTQLLFSTAADAKGSPSIVVTAQPTHRESADFYIQAVGKTGTVMYTANATGLGSCTGTVTIAPSGIVITSGMLTTTPPGDRIITSAALGGRNVRIYAALLDASMHYVAPQLVAGGKKVNVGVTSSDPSVGAITESQVTIPSGQAYVISVFQPKAAGITKLAASAPPGFEVPVQYGQLTATVIGPSIGLAEQMTVGKNLQYCDTLLLSEVAPREGLAVTLSSDNPDLLVSSGGTTPGSKSLTIPIPEGQNRTPYCLQGLNDNGTATITASAPGHRSRTAAATLTPSGVLLGFRGPDEAELFRKEAAEREHGMLINLADGPIAFKLYMARLHPVNHRGADITVQGLRAGVSATVELKSSDPTVGIIESPVILTEQEAWAKFTPLHAGKTVVTIRTPDGFTTAGNANAYTIIVK